MGVIEEARAKLVGTWILQGKSSPVVYVFNATHRTRAFTTLPYELRLGDNGLLLVTSEETVAITHLTPNEMHWLKGNSTHILTR